MPGMSRQGAAGRQEHALMASRGRDIAVTAVAVVLTAVVFAAVAGHGVLAHIQHLDDAWLRLMISSRSGPVTAVAMFLNVLGLVYITLPVRIAIAGFLALRRRWWHLAAFVAAIAMSEILIGTLKGIYDRARPPGSLVATSGASFPSGHAIAASVTVVAAVIAPAGRSGRLTSSSSRCGTGSLTGAARRTGATRCGCTRTFCSRRCSSLTLPPPTGSRPSPTICTCRS